MSKHLTSTSSTRPSVPARISWTPQEQWVWEHICAGRVADLNFFDGKGTPLDPSKPANWPTSRILRSSFLWSILLEASYVEAIPVQGVQIKGAWWADELDCPKSQIHHDLWLHSCYFERPVNFQRLNLTGTLSFEKSSFSRQLSLPGAIIAGDLVLNGCTVAMPLDMKDIHVNGLLWFGGQGFFASINLQGSRIDRGLSISRN